MLSKSQNRTRKALLKVSFSLTGVRAVVRIEHLGKALIAVKNRMGHALNVYKFLKTDESQI